MGKAQLPDGWDTAPTRADIETLLGASTSHSPSSTPTGASLDAIVDGSANELIVAEQQPPYGLRNIGMQVANFYTGARNIVRWIGNYEGLDRPGDKDKLGKHLKHGIGGIAVGTGMAASTAAFATGAAVPIGVAVALWTGAYGLANLHQAGKDSVERYGEFISHGARGAIGLGTATAITTAVLTTPFSVPVLVGAGVAGGLATAYGGIHSWQALGAGVRHLYDASERRGRQQDLPRQMRD